MYNGGAGVALPDRFAPVPEARDRQVRRQAHQRLRRRGHEGLRGLTAGFTRAGKVPTYTPAQTEAIAFLDEPLQIIVVEVGKSIAERIPVGDRLPKAMVRAGHQSWARGDLRRRGRECGVDLR